MKYIEIYEEIKAKILSGNYTPWSSLEGEEVLCLRYQVSRLTLRKAINKLKQEGLVHSKQGSGVFVNPEEFHSKQDLRTLSEKYSDRRVTSKILYFEKVEATEKLANIFNMNRNEMLYHYKRVRYVDDQPFTIEETYMPVYLFPNFEQEALLGSVMGYIEEKYKLKISHDIKKIKALMPDQDVCDALGLDEPQPMLSIQHTVYLTKSIAAQYTTEVEKENEITVAQVR